MNPIGGYFELELNNGEEYHKNALKLNTGRNAFEYVLLAKKYKKVWLPYYTCDVMLEPLKKNAIDYEFYSLNSTLYPNMNFSKLKKDDVLVYTNYFGLCDQNVEKIVDKSVNTIIDNSQAFFSNPINETDTFYSPRKFFGVPDGGYLYTNGTLKTELARDYSFTRYEHLVGRIERGPKEFYHSFKENDKKLSQQEIKIMSKSTQRLLENIDYENSKKRRFENFSYLHGKLKHINSFPLVQDNNLSPMVYPLLIPNGAQLKEYLISQNIFVPTYWPNVGDWLNEDNTIEMNLFQNLIALPIDQRYTVNEMKTITDLIENGL